MPLATPTVGIEVGMPRTGGSPDGTTPVVVLVGLLLALGMGFRRAAFRRAR
jgi:hypothetical protein